MGRSSAQFKLQCDKYPSDINDSPSDLGDRRQVRTDILNDVVILRVFLTKSILYVILRDVHVVILQIHRTLTRNIPMMFTQKHANAMKKEIFSQRISVFAVKGQCSGPCREAVPALASTYRTVERERPAITWRARPSACLGSCCARACEPCTLRCSGDAAI